MVQRPRRRVSVLSVRGVQEDGMSDTLRELVEAVIIAKRDERHRNHKETMYWFHEWKRIALGLEAALAREEAPRAPSTLSGQCGCDGPNRIDPNCQWHGVVARAVTISEEASGWQPIETAPKDGTKVDIWAKCWRPHYDDFIYIR